MKFSRMLYLLFFCLSKIAIASHMTQDQFDIAIHLHESCNNTTEAEHDELSLYQKALFKKYTELGILTARAAMIFAAPLFEELLTNRFGWATYAHVNPAQRNNLKGIYTLLWTALGEHGWSLWHPACLEKLTLRHNENKRFLYIAGGTDIFTLIENGIYNFDVIDPLFKTQERYYVSSYTWLYGGDKDAQIGDVFEQEFKTKKLFFERTILKKDPVFSAWEIKNSSNQTLGQINLIQRKINQEDFHTDKEILISYNELIFLCLPSTIGGWDIDIRKFSERKNLFIKQTQNPLSLEMLLKLRILLTLSYVDFKFIGLGNDVE